MARWRGPPSAGRVGGGDESRRDLGSLGSQPFPSMDECREALAPGEGLLVDGVWGWTKAPSEGLGAMVDASPMSFMNHSYARCSRWWPLVGKGGRAHGERTPLSICKHGEVLRGETFHSPLPQSGSQTWMDKTGNFSLKQISATKIDLF